MSGKEREMIDSGEWVPSGYEQHLEWERADRLVAGIAAFLTIPLFILTLGPTIESANVFIQWYGELLHPTFLSEGVALTNISRFLTWLTIVLISGCVVGVHEAIHYSVSKFVGFSPKVVWVEFAWLKNPAVVNTGYRIPARRQIPGTVAPLVLIGLFSVSGYLLIDGRLSGLFAWVLLINTSVSAADIALAIRLLRLPKGTLFVNMETPEGIRTVVALPK